MGGKDFGFTWSSELGVCDIYKECQSEHDGSGLLVESGTVWRKLNINRVLDESIKNHVKMRSEEAERQHRSRKYVSVRFLLLNTSSILKTSLLTQL